MATMGRCNIGRPAVVLATSPNDESTASFLHVNKLVDIAMNIVPP